MIRVSEKSKIYVICPPKLKTGGTELLHQLVYKLNSLNKNCYIVYSTDAQDEDCTPNDFKSYIKEYKFINDIEDNEDSIIIVPETKIECIKKVKNAKKIIWWLSVDNYKKRYYFFYNIKNKLFKRAFKNFLSGRIFLKKLLKKADYHLCQCYYIIEFLKKSRIEKNVMYLSDYINKTYLTVNFNSEIKENIVLYNPKKGIDQTNKIKKIVNSDIKWLPIENMTTEQVKEVLLKSKVYIDFGNHPGKDRFPREAAMCGCCVITGKKGSANYYEDVPIDTKFDDRMNNKNLKLIKEKIEDCVYNYDNNINNYNNYREVILKEEEKFEEDIKKIFGG